MFSTPLRPLARPLGRPLAGAMFAVALLTGSALSPAMAQDDAVIATVNGENITNSQLALAEQDLDPQFGRLPPEQKRAAALSALIEIRLLAAKAVTDGLDKQADFQAKLDFLRQRALHSAVVESEIAKGVSDEELQARYTEEVAKTPPVNEIRARHILVKTEEEAAAVLKQLGEGGNFEEIAKEKSTDGAAAQGGDLGYFGPGQMVPEFEKAAFAIEPGQYGKEAIKTQFGFHVIKVEDKRTQQAPAFDQVKDQVRSIVLRDKYLALVKGLRDGASVEIVDPALKAGVETIDAPQPAADPNAVPLPAGEAPAEGTPAPESTTP